MKVTVIEIFQDKFGEHHYVGDVIEIADSERIANLEAKNLIKVDSVAEKKPTKRRVKEEA